MSTTRDVKTDKGVTTLIFLDKDRNPVDEDEANSVEVIDKDKNGKVLSRDYLTRPGNSRELGNEATNIPVAGAGDSKPPVNTDKGS